MIKANASAVKSPFSKLSGSDKTFELILVAISLVIIVITLYPLYFVVIASFSNPELVLTGKITLLPKEITFDAYKKVFENEKIWNGYKNTVIYTVLGTAVNMILTTLAAYPLSRRDMPFRNFFMMFITFTMLFGGGLVPTYLVVKSLHLTNNIWAMVIPGAISTYNLIVMRTYFQNSIPFELQESASIDGCSDWRLLFSIILPLSKPIMAVLVLFYAVGHWNAFFNALIYLRDQALYPLQLILREILLQNQLDIDSGDSVGMYQNLLTGEAMKYSVILISSLPVLLLYPFVQKYFVKGVMIGALKG